MLTSPLLPYVDQKVISTSRKTFPSFKFSEETIAITTLLILHDAKDLLPSAVYDKLLQIRLKRSRIMSAFFPTYNLSSCKIKGGR